ncbi:MULTISPECIES: L-rhamnose mutarotase [Pantoea]|jgi:L-rhamnose mutarotase|uniref:L-rhamnose mutarotase n=1 Tax=Pantoea brenneri TaxID=472694 RepID=A0A7Y6NHH6_9GAMM|nr:MULTISPECIES: L-rhamnose mutarotase [Pantoea]MBZ6397178.1 L-rhamnose mutarotase [Pantoea sp.]MBZ6440443.1 L-rhamnose mutarotase [Pantoea sp.]NUY43674.1 L-rhamnose mutarotase [Pantoea brenneri]NUY51211.1 L-rhamnose mutarotase [Pantoea brenneri]NUY61504.1 L-rhamnose mutarotase [Pantoea brenneri]
MTRRYCQALDLSDDPRLIAEYQRYHQQIWPEITAHLRRYGIAEMEIYRLGNRLMMVIETTNDFDRALFERRSLEDPKVCEWEALMWKYQRPTPWTAAGEKWVEMTRIFSLTEQP